jgi:hypothetical protein
VDRLLNAADFRKSLIPESGVKRWISGLKWFELADAAEYVADQIP